MSSTIRVFLALLVLSACESEVPRPALEEATNEETRPDEASNEETWPDREYPRAVIVSPTDSILGFATWLGEGAAAKAFAEDGQLIDMVWEGLHLSDTEAFEARVIELGGHVEPNYPWLDLEIQVAKGPYILDERGGNERIVERSEVQWW